MINFFRKTRRKLADNNQVFKYSRYARGEILLVVIGILIALQINNWNENRKINKTRISYFNRLKNDLNGDNNNLAQLIEGRKAHMDRVDSFRRLFNQGNYTSMQLKDSIILVGRGLHRYIPLDITYEELINSGNIGLLPEKLRIFMAELDRTKDFYHTINAQVINSFFNQKLEVRKYWNHSDLNFSESMGVESNDEDVLKGLRLEVNVMMDTYSWSRDNIERYEELIERNKTLIGLIDLELKIF